MTSLFLCATISSKHYISVNTTPQHIFIGAYHFEEGRPLRIFRQRHGNFQCFMLPINSRKMDMSDANDAVGVNVFVGKKPLDNDIAAFVIDIIQLSAHITE